MQDPAAFAINVGCLSFGFGFGAEAFLELAQITF